MQKLLAPPPATLAPPPAPRRVVNFEPFKTKPSSSYLETDFITEFDITDDELQSVLDEVTPSIETPLSSTPKRSPQSRAQITNFQWQPSFQSQPSYQQPSTSYQQPNTSYQQPSTSYQQPNTSYQQPSTSYQQPNTSYQHPNISYQQPSTSYQQPQIFPGYQENRSSPKMLSTPPNTSYQQPQIFPVSQEDRSSPKMLSTPPNTSYQQPQIFPGYQENRSSPKMLSTPPTRFKAPKVFSPRRSLEAILTRFTHEKDAGRMCVQLAQDYFFGKEEMAQRTAGKLDRSRMQRIRSIVLSKFGGRRSVADREALWAKCKVAIGHKCKHFRSDRRQS